MSAYHNDPQQKKEAVENAIRHKEMDMLAKETYGEMNGSFKGCDVGCDAFDITGEIQKKPHIITSYYFGWPIWVERLRDFLFEGLPGEKAVEWHINFKKATPVGLDEEGYKVIKAKILIFILDHILETLADKKNYDGKDEIITVVNQLKLIWLNYIDTNILDKTAVSDAAVVAAAAAAAVAVAGVVAADAADAATVVAAVAAAAATDAAAAVVVAAAATAATDATDAAAAADAAADAAAVAFVDAVAADADAFSVAAFAIAAVAADSDADAAAFADAVAVTDAIAAIAAAAFADAAVYEKYANYFIELLKNSKNEI